MTPYGNISIIRSSRYWYSFYVICLLITRPDHNAPDASHAITNTTLCWVQFAGFINQKTKLNLTRPDVLPLNTALTLRYMSVTNHWAMCSRAKKKKKKQPFFPTDLIHGGSWAYQQALYTCSQVQSLIYQLTSKMALPGTYFSTYKSVKWSKPGSSLPVPGKVRTGPSSVNHLLNAL